MIKVEKKFILTDRDRTALLEGATPLGVKKFTDVYYDTADHELTKKEWWLRSRDGRFELKIPMSNRQESGGTDQFDELEEEDQVRKQLHMRMDGPIREVLSEAGYSPFATIETTRTKYKKDKFNIDIDLADYGYALAEIELLIDAKEEIKGAQEEITAFARAYGLSEASVRGKVIEYLWRKDRNHFHALETAWGVKL